MREDYDKILRVAVAVVEYGEKMLRSPDSWLHYQYHKLPKSRKLNGVAAAVDDAGDVAADAAAASGGGGEGGVGAVAADEVSACRSSSSGHITRCLLAAGSDVEALLMLLNMYFIWGM